MLILHITNAFGNSAFQYNTAGLSTDMLSQELLTSSTEGFLGKKSVTAEEHHHVVRLFHGPLKNLRVLERVLLWREGRGGSVIVGGSGEGARQNIRARVVLSDFHFRETARAVASWLEITIAVALYYRSCYCGCCNGCNGT